MFRGTQKGSVDGKGRLKLPVIAKRGLMDRYGEMKVFITSYEGTKVKVYPISEWERKEKTLSQPGGGSSQLGDPLSRQRLLFNANHFGSEEKVDRQGRLLVPASLRDSAGMKGPVKIQWQTSHMLVLSNENYDLEIEANKLNDADLVLAAELGL